MCFRAYGSQLFQRRKDGFKIWTSCTEARVTLTKAFLKAIILSGGNTSSCSTRDSIFSVLERLYLGRVKQSLPLPLFFARCAQFSMPLSSVT